MGTELDLFRLTRMQDARVRASLIIIRRLSSSVFARVRAYCLSSIEQLVRALRVDGAALASARDKPPAGCDPAHSDGMLLHWLPGKQSRRYSLQTLVSNRSHRLRGFRARAPVAA